MYVIDVWCAEIAMSMVKIHSPDWRLVKKVRPTFDCGVFQNEPVARKHPTLCFDFKYSGIPRDCTLCGKKGFRREFVTATGICLAQVKGLQRLGLARFAGGERFLPDASFGCARRQRRRGGEARDDEQPEQEDCFLSRVQAAGR